MSSTDVHIARFLRRLGEALAADRVFLTRKAAQEASEELGFDRHTVFELLSELVVADFDHEVSSTSVPGDVIWVFTPAYDDGMLWIRLVERGSVVVVSFHEA